MDLKVRVDELCSRTGLLLGAEDNAMLVLLQNRVDKLRQDVGAKTRKNSLLDEYIHQAQLELEAKKNLHHDYMNNMSQDLARFREGQRCLATFFEFLNSKDFAMNNIKSIVDQHLQFYWQELKPFNDKAKAISAELDELRELRDKCVQLREKTAQKKAANQVG